jgi:hypothetical protein
MHRDGQNSTEKISCLGETNSSPVCVCDRGNHILPVLRLNSFRVVQTKTNSLVVVSVVETEVNQLDPGAVSNGFGVPLELPPRL